MSIFEKIIIPLAVDHISRKDLTEKAGFIDSYTYDEDRPQNTGCLLLAFNDEIRSEESIDLSRRYSVSKFLCKTYIKRVNNIPYYVYSFWIPAEFKKFNSGNICLTPEEKIRILQFWGPSEDVVTYVLRDPVVYANPEHKMPLEDYNEPIYRGIKIGGSLK